MIFITLTFNFQGFQIICTLSIQVDSLNSLCIKIAEESLKSDKHEPVTYAVDVLYAEVCLNS